MASSFAPTQDELGLVTQVFAIADPQKIGIVTGEAAVKVFTGAKLSPTVLGEIWNIADADNNGFLSKKGVAIALRLIGWAQKGEKVTAALVNKCTWSPTITSGLELTRVC
jgi:epidermal growth factor receptor substrate 15